MSRFEEVDYSSLSDTMQGLLQQGNEIWRSLAISAQRLLDDLLSFQTPEDVAVRLSQRPLLGVFILAMVLSCGVPVLLFALFAFLTFMMTFTGFLVIEGTILTIGSVVLCGFILAMMIVMLSITATIGLAYFGFTEMFGLMTANIKRPIKSNDHREQSERNRRIADVFQDLED